MSPFQILNLPNGQIIGNRIAKAAMEENLANTDQVPDKALPVSYTHLTLPTNKEV